MEHPGFAIVHVQSPCTTYNDTYGALKGNPKKGIAPLIYEVPEKHDPRSRAAAFELIHAPGIPAGIIYRDDRRSSFTQRMEELRARVKPKSAQELLNGYGF